MLLPVPLLRSIIRFNDEDEELLSFNLYTVRHELEPPGVDGQILEFVSDIFDKTKAVPRIELVETAFKDRQNEAAQARLQDLNVTIDMSGWSPVNFLSGPEFRYSFDQYKKQLSSESVSRMLLESSQILAGGIQRSGAFIEGPDAVLQHLTSSISLLHTSLKRGAIEGSFRRDAGLIRRQYDHWKSNPADTVGVLTGIDKIDMVHRGVRNGELVLVAGFTSHLKTSFCFNWLYKAAVYFGRNVAIASMETSIDDLRMAFYVLHSSHTKFADQNLPPLDFEKVTSGSLNPDEEKTLDKVIEDLGESPDYGEVFYKEPQDEITVHEIARWAESKHKTTPLDMLVIDYFNMVDAARGKSSIESNANLNVVIRQGKSLAMTFGNGRGIPVVSPFQTNREGLKDAEKNGGRYKLTALANANEAERSTDKVYYVYLDDVLRNSRELIVGNLKNRRGPLIQDQIKVLANPSCRLIDNLDTLGVAADLVEI